jgi:hypothetical protein
MSLTDKECKAAKGKEKPYKMADGGGLYLLVKVNGARHRCADRRRKCALTPANYVHQNRSPVSSLADSAFASSLLMLSHS